jgi:hypothetical protein
VIEDARALGLDLDKKPTGTPQRSREARAWRFDVAAIAT